MYRFTAAGATHVGHVRDLNEDAYLIRDGLYLVADGMGGHDGGELASAAVIDTFATAWENNTEPLELFTLQEWLTEANRNVYDIATGRAGTTLTLLTNVLHQDKEQLVIANVGDSRTYRYRASDEVFMQLTQDHSAVAEMVRLGQLTPDEAREHPARNVITRAVGSALRLLADVLLLDAEIGDRFLLCTDGLTGKVEDQEIGLILASAATVQDAADQLVELALETDGSDNVTVIVAEVLEH
ncbi:PP2C family protein-serine/threonine phosphatase [Enteractinococcus coprophilus]|uniref:Protein phosphatase n=1 Tax=Enteractinococcus coprophilus TaxID=1027633 RepID=A0A543AF72_9MICC|nr:protein phosphatase 2C domain-containing protein [Enteractinococcus coprophilus]TQL71223.1 protein phosphatase [Enteractinococcus coprophilus]